MVNVESFWWWWCRVKAVGSCLRHCKGAWPSSFIHFIKTVLWLCFGKATLQVLLCRVLVKWPKLITDQLTSQFILCPGWSTSVYCRVSTCGKWRKKLPALRIGLTVLLPCGSFRGCLWPIWLQRQGWSSLEKQEWAIVSQTNIWMALKAMLGKLLRG